MQAKYLHLSLIIALLLSACAAPPAPSPTADAAARDAAAAQATLEQFLEQMRRGDYRGAAALYGGSYETLRDWNPGIAPNDRAALLESGCRVNGLRCLAPASITHSSTDPTGVFTFTVTFGEEDGRPFVLAIPDMPKVSEFPFTVVKTRNGFLVNTLPPYGG
jgi:type II secretory pathway pseudopilin PulG